MVRADAPQVDCEDQVRVGSPAPSRAIDASPYSYKAVGSEVLKAMSRRETHVAKSIAVAIALMLAISVAGSVAGQGPVALGAVEKITVHGKSLEGNLNGDTPGRSVFLYLPPSYKADASIRLRVMNRRSR